MDLDLRTVLRVGGEVAQFLCVLNAALFVAIALTSDEDLDIEPQSGGPLSKRIWAWLYFVALLAGIAVVIGGGVWRVLAWMPATWGDARVAVAGMSALSAWPIAFALANLPTLRRGLAVKSVVAEWMRQELRFGAPASVSDVEEFAKEREKRWASSRERLVAKEKLELVTALLDRDRKLETYFIQKQELEEAHAAAERERVQMEAQRRAEKEEEIERRAAIVESTLAGFVRSLRTVSETSELQRNEEALLEHEIVVAAWYTFRELVLSVLPKTADEVPVARSQLAANLPKLKGVLVPQHMRIECRFETRTFHRVLAVIGSDELPLAMGLRYESSMSGLLNGFFLTAALQRTWSWPREPEPMLTMNGLARLLIEHRLPILNAQFQRWPPPGIRVQRTAGETYEVACLSARPPGGLAELCLTIDCGVPSKLRLRDVFPFPTGGH